MKIWKKALSCFLALVMAVCLLPVTALAADGDVAEVNGTGYPTLAAAIDVAAAGDTVKLLRDAVLEPQDGEADTLSPLLVIDKDLTLDLNGYSIQWDTDNITEDTEFTATIVFFSVDGATLTITGNGTIDAEAVYNNSYGIDIVNDGTVVIENGSFYGAPTAVQVSKGSLIIEGGSFDLAKTIKSVLPAYAKYIVNAIDGAWADGTATIAISGGTFSYDFSNNPEGDGTTYLVPGYEFIDGSVQTSTDVVVKVLNANGNVLGAYTSIQAAIAAAEDGDVIELLKDVEISGGNGNTTGIITITKDITLNGNDHTIQAVEPVAEKSSLINIQNGADVTINHLVVDGNSKTKHGLNINQAGEVTLNAVTVTGNTWYGIVDNGSVVTGNDLEITGNTWGINVDKGGKFSVVSGTVDGDFVVEASGGNAGSAAIYGGTFTGEVKLQNGAAKDNLVISGGVFANDVSDYLAKDATIWYNGQTWTVYSSNQVNYAWLDGLLPILGAQVQSPFVDVNVLDYYYDAVNWAVDNGITTGTGRYSFSPDEPCTRAQAVTFLWRAAGSPAPKSNVTAFADVDSSAYYAKAVAWAVENGVTNGTSATTFSPSATCTRAQIVTFLYRAFGKSVNASVPFTDVAANAYFAPAVAWAAANNVTGGTTPTTFSPAATCTRAQIVTFLYRCCK